MHAQRWMEHQLIEELQLENKASKQWDNYWLEQSLHVKIVDWHEHVVDLWCNEWYIGFVEHDRWLSFFDLLYLMMFDLIHFYKDRCSNVLMRSFGLTCEIEYWRILRRSMEINTVL